MNGIAPPPGHVQLELRHAWVQQQRERYRNRERFFASVRKSESVGPVDEVSGLHWWSKGWGNGGWNPWNTTILRCPECGAARECPSRRCDECERDDYRVPTIDLKGAA